MKNKFQLKPKPFLVRNYNIQYVVLAYVNSQIETIHFFNTFATEKLIKNREYLLAANT